MARFPFTPAWSAENNIRQFNEAAAQAFTLGAAVLLDGANNVAECGADPAAILGFALHPATKNVGGVTDLVALCVGNRKFWVSGTTNPVYADINVKYGITKQADSIWCLDHAKTGASARVYVHAIDTDRNLFLVSVLQANQQIAP